MLNKRGQGLSTNAIILIVLGVIVLVVLIVGFTMGWDRLAPWLSGSNNVDTIVQQCSVACSTQSVYDYCQGKRTLTVDKTKIKDATCYYLSEEQKTYAIAECPAVNCKATVILVACAPTTDAGKISQVLDTATKTVSSDVCT